MCVGEGKRVCSDPQRTVQIEMQRPFPCSLALHFLGAPQPLQLQLSSPHLLSEG